MKGVVERGRRQDASDSNQTGDLVLEFILRCFMCYDDFFLLRGGMLMDLIAALEGDGSSTWIVRVECWGLLVVWYGWDVEFLNGPMGEDAVMGKERKGAEKGR